MLLEPAYRRGCFRAGFVVCQSIALCFQPCHGESLRRRGRAANLRGPLPAEAPIKGNQSSGIYHVPGGDDYDVTDPEQCFAKPQDAKAAGLVAGGLGIRVMILKGAGAEI